MEIINAIIGFISLFLIGVIFGYLMGIRYALKQFQSSIDDMINQNKNKKPTS